jgi:hypothetical protein
MPLFSAASASPVVTAFAQRMQELGYVAGRDEGVVATATTLNGRRARSCVSHGYFSRCWRARRKTACAHQDQDATL